MLSPVLKCISYYYSVIVRPRDQRDCHLKESLLHFPSGEDAKGRNRFNQEAKEERTVGKSISCYFYEKEQVRHGKQF